MKPFRQIAIFVLAMLFRFSPSWGFDKKNPPSDMSQMLLKTVKKWTKNIRPNKSFEYKPLNTKPTIGLKKGINMVNKADLPGWIVGFTDGEGCFSVSFNLRKSLNVGVETRPSFAIGQKAHSLSSLNIMKDYFGCGHIRYSKSDGTYKYEVRDINDLCKKVLPFFEKYNLETAKKNDFTTFAEICRSIKQNQHLNEDGIKKIIEKSYTMNPSGKRKLSADELMREVNKKFKSN